MKTAGRTRTSPAVEPNGTGTCAVGEPVLADLDPPGRAMSTTTSAISGTLWGGSTPDPHEAAPVPTMSRRPPGMPTPGHHRGDHCTCACSACDCHNATHSKDGDPASPVCYLCGTGCHKRRARR